MKKIVALVLCLALALSLCTVSFAATKTVDVEVDGYSLLDMYNTEVDDELDSLTKTVTDPTTETAKDGTVTTTYYADVYEVDDLTKYYAVDSEFATLKLVKDGKVVAFLTASATEITATKKGAVLVEAKDAEDQECGDLVNDSYKIGSDYYAEGTAAWAVTSAGTFVQIGAKLDLTDATAAVQHKFTTKTTTVDGKIKTAKCDVCEKTYDVVEAGKLSATYTGLVDDTSFAGYLVVLGNATASAGSSSTTVESAKTFDAGIALYAGMALASVAGSAVVIGKKKEF